MFKRCFLLTGMLVLAMTFFADRVLAHRPLCSCFDNGDGTITCEGGFGDGTSATGVQMRVETKDGGVLIKGKLDEDSEFTFDRPPEGYNVVFDAGAGHVIHIAGEEIDY